MRFLDFVQKNNRIWFPSDGFGQLTALIVAHISRRRTDKTAHRVTLLILRHINPRNHILVIEQELRQALCKFGFAHTCGSEEHKRTNRSLLVLQSRP